MNDPLARDGVLDQKEEPVKRSLVLLSLAAAALVPSGAGARHLCVGYSVTAPVVGTQSGSPCSPVQLPPQFNGTEYWSDCTEVPPAGVTVCVTVSTHLPM